MPYAGRVPVVSDGTRRLSEHFRLLEFACKDGTPVPRAVEDLLRDDLCRRVLEPLRARYGPCFVTSGYRHPAYNARIGGASDSRHIYRDVRQRGLAADVVFARGTVGEWARSASAILDALGWGGGVGSYPHSGFVHVDTRRTRARW